MDTLKSTIVKVTIGKTTRDIEVQHSPNGCIFTKENCVAYRYKTGTKIHISAGHVVNGRIAPTYHRTSMMVPVCFADEVEANNNISKNW